MLSTLPLMALFLVQYTMVTIEAPVASTLGGATTSVSSSSDLEGQLGDLVIPQQETANTTTNTSADSTQTRKNRSVPDYDTLLSEIGDFRLPSNITAGHMAKVVKQAVPSVSDAEILGIIQALHPKQSGSPP